MTEKGNPISIEFLTYNRWANLKLLDFCITLAPEQLEISAPGVYGSIYATLIHIVRAEGGYLKKLSSTTMPAPLVWEDNPPLSDLRPLAEQISSALIETAGQTNLTDIVHEEWDGQTFSYKALTLLIQIVNHGVEHRTNVTTLLAQHGLQPPDLDGWGYMESNPDRMGA